MCKAINRKLLADGPHLWKELVKRRYDNFREIGAVDWKYIYQSRNWVERKLRSEKYESLIADLEGKESPMTTKNQPSWKVSGEGLLKVVRDMVIENGSSHLASQSNLSATKNWELLEPSTLLDGLRARSQYSQLSAFLGIILSPIGKFHAHMERSVFSVTQRSVYVPQRHPLFHNKVADFEVLLCILKFFQHHLDHMRLHIGPVTRQALNWDNAGEDGPFAFTPTSSVTIKDFSCDPQLLAGDWIGLYSYLGWADFEALRDENPAALEANRRGNLRDYLGGPQQLTIRIPHIEIPEFHTEDIPITGDGVNGGSFTFRGRLKRVHIPATVAGREMDLYWRITFTKTYAIGENSWTRWIYDGVYCPGEFLLDTS